MQFKIQVRLQKDTIKYSYHLDKDEEQLNACIQLQYLGSTTTD